MPKRIHIPATNDLWDEEKSEFFSIKEQTLVIEHSLLSISRWEQEWKKSFISTEDKTYAELKSYIKYMTLNQVNEKVYDVLPAEALKEIEDYISDPMTATTITTAIPAKQKHVSKVVTAEEIYYKMISYGIPIEFEKRHVNHLIALIRVFDVYNSGTGTMSSREAALFQRSLNEKRRRKR